MPFGDSENSYKIMNRIVNAEVVYPTHWSPETISLISQVRCQSKFPSNSLSLWDGSCVSVISSSTWRFSRISAYLPYNLCCNDMTSHPVPCVILSLTPAELCLPDVELLELHLLLPLHCHVIRPLQWTARSMVFLPQRNARSELCLNV